MEMLAVGIGHVLGRVVEVHVVVVVAVHKLPDVEGRTHGKEVGHLVGVAEGEVQGLVASKAAAGHPDFVDVALTLQHGHQLVAEKLVVENVVLHAHGGRQVLGVPRKPVDAVDAKQLDAAGFDQRAGGFDKLKVAGLVVAAAGSGENDNRVAPAAKHEHVNVLAQVMRVKAAVLFLQNVESEG